MNLVVIKQSVDEIIELLDEIIEDDYMHGDTSSAEEHESEQKQFKKAKEELSGLQNSEVYEAFILRELRKHVPSLNLFALRTYSESLTGRKERKLQELQKEIDNHKRIVDIIPLSEVVYDTKN